MDDLISRKDLLNNMRAGCIPLDEPEISGLIGDEETSGEVEWLNLEDGNAFQPG